MEDIQKLLPGFPRIAPQAPFLQVAPNMNVAANMLPMQHLQPTGQLEYKVRGGLAHEESPARWVGAAAWPGVAMDPAWNGPSPGA